MLEHEWKARARYIEYTSNHPTIHCNRFPAWEELTQTQKDEWVEDHPAIGYRDADIVAVGRNWIETQIASMSPEQVEAAALYFSGQTIGGPPSDWAYENYVWTIGQQDDWARPYPTLRRVIREAYRKKLYQE